MNLKLKNTRIIRKTKRLVIKRTENDITKIKMKSYESYEKNVP
jgi:hypothetical protein